MIGIGNAYCRIRRIGDFHAVQNEDNRIVAVNRKLTFSQSSAYAVYAGRGYGHGFSLNLHTGSGSRTSLIRKRNVLGGSILPCCFSSSGELFCRLQCVFRGYRRILSQLFCRCFSKPHAVNNKRSQTCRQSGNQNDFNRFCHRIHLIIFLFLPRDLLLDPFLHQYRLPYRS